MASEPPVAVYDACVLYRNVLIGSIKRARQNLRRTQPSDEEFIDALDAQGLTAFSRILRRKAAQLV